MNTATPGTLYIVATPIGNLEDITLRALRILKEVDLILCEDTRHTKKLLSHFDIHTKTDSLHARTDKRKFETIARKLEHGQSLALVSDAGTPLISDPGSPLISYIREILGDELHIVPIPGPSALTTALSVIPVKGGHFEFLGFIPQKKGRQSAIKSMREAPVSQVFYESSHRIQKLLSELRDHYPEAHVYLARELTKQFEEIIDGSPEKLALLLEQHPEKQKGEFVVVISK